jgi:phage terminase large subunit
VRSPWSVPDPAPTLPVNPFGVVFDEYAVMETSHPWELIRPILAENGGWAAFFFTPNGRNHGYDLYQQARANPEWFVTLKTVEDTRRDARGRDGQPLPGKDGRLILPMAQVAEEIRAGMPPALAEQEFKCSWLAATPWAFYAAELARAERQGADQDGAVGAAVARRHGMGPRH